ncbi:Alpha/Beta hydrolase protein [Mycena galopus ATCC 62051]|nr:Alpha/Beta hydrolase protein [Mycena galopus ATCC 62051]
MSRKYGQLSWIESFGTVLALLPLPVVLCWNVVTTAYAPFNKERSFRRIIADCALRYITSHLSVPQLQAASGSTFGMYEKWTKKTKLPAIVDELGEDARLLWIGPKRLERVVLWLHGGAFFQHPPDVALSFWRYVQLELEKQNIEVGFVMLNYSLIPDAAFPTPLKQAALAVNFLLAAGVKPQNLQLAGDSAGGNLALQVLSQILHPLQGVPDIRLPAPLRGVYLASPWVNLCADSKSHTENEGRDYLSSRPFAQWGATAVRAPEGWFAGVDALVECVLITAGGAELLRDDRYHSNTELVVQKDALHNDVFLEFMANENRDGGLTLLTVDGWLRVFSA